MAINLKTGVTVGREGEEIAAVFTRKSLKEHDAKVRADAIDEVIDYLYEPWSKLPLNITVTIENCMDALDCARLDLKLKEKK